MAGLGSSTMDYTRTLGWVELRSSGTFVARWGSVLLGPTWLAGYFPDGLHWDTGLGRAGILWDPCGHPGHTSKLWHWGHSWGCTALRTPRTYVTSWGTLLRMVPGLWIGLGRT